jgi:hypothetical protein
MTAISEVTQDLGTLFQGGAFGGGVAGQIAQSVAVGGTGSAIIASLQHPDVLAKLDPLGVLNIFHPSGTTAPPTTPVTPAQQAQLVGLNPANKTFTFSWAVANPTLVPLYQGSGWTPISG